MANEIVTYNIRWFLLMTSQVFHWSMCGPSGSLMAAGLLFDACISASKTRETAKGGEDGEEFHFEVAEGRRG